MDNQQLTMALKCRGSILSKILAGAGYAARAYIYQGSSVSDMELNSPQYLLLALLYSLVTEDVMSCCLLADVCLNVRQLRSDYLRTWLSGDFHFPRQDMEKAMALLAKLFEKGVLKLPSHAIRIMSSLAARYRIHGVQLMSASSVGRQVLASHLKATVVNNSPADIIALACEGGDVNGSTQSGDSLVHLAARLGNCSSIAALAFLKVDLETLNSSNATPLLEAVKNNNGSVVKALLSYGAKIEKRFIRGDNYLHIAASGSHNEALALLEKGIDVNKKNHFHETPLFQAVRAGNLHGVDLLIKAGADAGMLPEGGKSLVEMAVESQNVEIFTSLFKSGSKLNSENGETVLHLVARLGNVGMFKEIKEMCTDVNEKTKKGETALYFASTRGSLELVRALYQEGAIVDTQDNSGTSALMIALKNSKKDIAKFLLHNGANLNIKDNQGRTAIHYATEGGCARMMAILLDAGSRVNDQDNKGDTAAIFAAVNNKPAVLRLLVKNGAGLALDGDGDGILHHKARSGHVEVVTALLDAGAEVDMKGQLQFTALHCAAARGHTAVVEALLDRGADLDARSAIGSTPLIEASYYGHLAAVQLLVDRGAQVNAKKNDGWTALGFTNCWHYRAISDYLRSRGGVE